MTHASCRKRCFSVSKAWEAGVSFFGGARREGSSGAAAAPSGIPGLTTLKATSGACLFLGTLDLNYAVANGMFFLGHYFSYALVLNVSFLIPFGLISLVILHKKAGPLPDS